MSKTTDLTEYEKAKRRKRRRIFNICLYIAAAVLIIGGAVIVLRDQTTIFNRNSAEAPDVTFPPQAVGTASPDDPVLIGSESPEPTVTPVPTPEPEPSVPVSISFVDYGIDVAVVPVGTDEQGRMIAYPAYDIAGWFDQSSAPNQNGNCIIAGHNRYQGQMGLFSVLHTDLKNGDRITVKMENGNYMFYVVETIISVPYNDVPDYVMGQTDDRRLTLITCMGDYDHNLHMSRTRAIAICKPAG